MKAVGFITEYNPFHNGHLLHLQKAMELSKADCSVAVMSGNFVQRGEPSIIDKYARAAMAVKCGVNLVVELPSRYALGSAEKFAEGGILTLEKLEIDSVCFGSESGHLSELEEIAKMLASEPDKYQLALKKELKSGNSFPLARENALASLNIMDKDRLHEVLSSSNNILAIEYLKAIKRNACPIKAYTYKREGMGYNETFDSVDDNIEAVEGINNTAFASATALREEVFKSLCDNDEDAKNRIVSNMPPASAEIFFKALEYKAPVFTEDFDIIFNAKFNKLLSEASYNKKEAYEMLMEYEGFTESIANRLINKYAKFTDITKLIGKVKDKSLTYTAISRAIFHFILNHKTNASLLKTISNADPEELSQEIDGMKIYDPDFDSELLMENVNNNKEDISYIRILACDDKGKEYLSQIRKTCEVPLITKTAGFEELLKDDILAADLYNLAIWDAYGTDMPDEFHKGIYIKGLGFTGDGSDN